MESWGFEALQGSRKAQGEDGWLAAREGNDPDPPGKRKEAVQSHRKGNIKWWYLCCLLIKGNISSFSCSHGHEKCDIVTGSHGREIERQNGAVRSDVTSCCLHVALCFQYLGDKAPRVPIVEPTSLDRAIFCRCCHDR